MGARTGVVQGSVPAAIRTLHDPQASTRAGQPFAAAAARTRSASAPAV